jgi:hypothetical protein
LIAVIGSLHCLCTIFIDPMGSALAPWSNPMAVNTAFLFWALGTYCMFEMPEEVAHG